MEICFFIILIINLVLFPFRLVPQNYDALIVRSVTQVTKEVIDAGRNLKLIGRAGVGVDNIDVPAATAAGIVVIK